MEPVKQITLEREYDAPVAQVWQAWTDPSMLKQWWGPNGVSIPECSVDLRIGGRFHIVMEAGEMMGPYKGTLWPMEATFTVIEPNSRLAYAAKAWTEGANDRTMIDQTTDIQFSETNGRTKVVVTAAIHNAGPDAGMAVQGMQYGFTQQLEKLGAFLAK